MCSEPGKLFKIVLVSRRRDGHQHPRRLFADIGDVVRNARWNEQVGARGRADRLVPNMELTGSVAPGGMRSAGTDSTAQASDAQDERIARFSWTSSVASVSTS
ncbi:hypothetical protein X772_35165 [Mesorhizobium sp. LSJC280B00]|nr:hypothetical protein X772_35165 [Mesorhizobium sp. LSJC280B00]